MPTAKAVSAKRSAALRGPIPALAALVLCACAVHADSPSPEEPYVLASPDGRFHFAMLTRRESAFVDGRFYNESGLYDARGDGTPLWTTEGYAFSVHLSPDGVHFVEPGPWASSFESQAVAFYSNGRLLRRYTIGELVKDPDSVARTVSHFFWRSGTAFYPDAGRYVIQTLEGNSYLFDITTGEVIRHEVEAPSSRYGADVATGGRGTFKAVDVRQCPGSVSRILGFERGRGPVFLGIEAAAADRGTVRRVLSFPFGEIRSVERVSGAGAASARFRIVPRDGKSVEVVPEGLYQICVTTADGTQTKISLDDLVSITNVVEQPAPPVPKPAGPPIAELIQGWAAGADWLKLGGVLYIPGGGKAVEPARCAHVRRRAVSRHGCFDVIGPGWQAVRLTIVFPADTAVEPFAISRTEITRAEYLRYCVLSGNCDPRDARINLEADPYGITHLPMHSVSLQEVESYAAWLSKETGHRYRLPSDVEWQATADARVAEKRSNCEAGKALVEIRAPAVAQDGSLRIFRVSVPRDVRQYWCSYEATDDTAWEVDASFGFYLVREGFDP